MPSTAVYDAHPTLIAVWGMTGAQAGSIATALITSAIGGWAAGVLSDKLGASGCCSSPYCGSPSSPSWRLHQLLRQLFFTRALQGRFEGEWSVGSVLVAEMIGASCGKAVGLVRCLGSWLGMAIAFWAVYPGRTSGVADPVLDHASHC
jgi:MFS family permease